MVEGARVNLEAGQIWRFDHETLELSVLNDKVTCAQKDEHNSNSGDQG